MIRNKQKATREIEKKGGREWRAEIIEIEKIYIMWTWM